MIIKKLVMYNFRQFIGEQLINFSIDAEKNVTVLVGINTSGKTTIIRAFEWCLYGKNGFDDQVLLNSEVRTNMNIGDIQETWVSVTFIFDNKEHTLKRKLKYICNDRTVQDGKVSVQLNKKPEESLTLEYIQCDGQTKTPIDRANITETMDRVLPKDLSDYFFFGGERISGIANRNDLSKAVRGLMRLDVLENAREHLKQVLKNFRANVDTSGDANAQKARDSLETYRKQKEQYDDDKNNAEEQMSYWQTKENEYNAELAKSNIEQVKKAKEERERLNQSILRNKEMLEDTKKAIVNSFNFRPFVFFGMPAIKKSLELLETVKESTESIPGMDQDSIDYILKRGYCICGTKLDPGSIPLLKVQQERMTLPPEHIGSVVMNYKNKSEGFLSGCDNYIEQVQSQYKNYRSILRQIGDLQDEYKKQSDLILDDTDAKIIENKRKDAHTHYVESKNDYDVASTNIGKCIANISNCEDAIEKYAKNSVKNQRISRFISYSEAVFDWLNETYKAKEDTVRVELQRRVNDNFSKMYHGERKIIIDERYTVKYSDIKTDESDGLKAVKSFAFIASLVSMAKDKILDDEEMKLGQDYPLVMDAPFSNVDEIHIDNICHILPHAANQIIMAVMKKDWDYASANLSRYVGESYIIMKDSDDNGKEIDTLTHIQKAEV